MKIEAKDIIRVIFKYYSIGHFVNLETVNTVVEEIMEVIASELEKVYDIGYSNGYRYATSKKDTNKNLNIKQL